MYRAREYDEGIQEPRSKCQNTPPPVIGNEENKSVEQKPGGEVRPKQYGFEQQVEGGRCHCRAKVVRYRRRCQKVWVTYAKECRVEAC